MDIENTADSSKLAKLNAKLDDMLETKLKQRSGGIGFFGLLFITFLVLKLTNVITWSWWWITAPLWGPIAIVLGVLLGGISIAFAVCLIIQIFTGDSSEDSSEEEEESN